MGDIWSGGGTLFELLFSNHQTDSEHLRLLKRLLSKVFCFKFGRASVPRIPFVIQALKTC